MWDNWSKKRNGLPVYDNWLDSYKDILDNNRNTQILDLGCGIGEELEKNFYFEGDYTKRFFDQEDINKYFGIIGTLESFETSMTRNEEEYSKPKVLYQIKVKRI